ncbi:glycerate kinase [Salinibacterium sp. ZJ77]|uniref:glycerate kinase n=1 Tax=Salinibacterium sp. ZJ77 TaxID=2708337 RepID=UPI00141E4865|nr:glycerate kinase [Salinibacterium sp. ZJ77]
MSTRTPVVVAAPDSFKGSATASDAADAIARGVLAALPGAEVVRMPMADGGEGTLDAVLASWGVQATAVDTVDALDRPRRGRIGFSSDGEQCIIEAAEANGLPHVRDVALQPLRADSFGVGMLARAALDAGVREVLLCIGGSASSDGGSGVLRALGARLLDSDGRDVPRGAHGLAQVHAIDATQLHRAASAVRWRVAVDVDNPLVGPRGAAAVFGPQKGAAPEHIAMIDEGLAHFARVVAEARGTDADELLAAPGFGAAGGLALALTAIAEVELVAGSQLVADAVGLADALDRADLVITGEGRLDEQSLGGKVVDAVRRMTPRRVPVVVIAGGVELDAERCRREGITAAFSLSRGASSLEELIPETLARLSDTAAQVCGLLGSAGASRHVGR